MAKRGMLRPIAALAMLVCLGTGLGSGPGRAQDFPPRTVRIVVPSAPGSTTDTLARIVADRLSRSWGKSAIVENVAGGAMNAGAANVARAAPDGTTLMVAPPAPLTFNDLLFRDLGYRPLFTTEQAMAECLPYYVDLYDEMKAAGTQPAVAVVARPAG